MTFDHLDIDRILAETFIARAEYHRTLTSTNDRASQCAAEVSGELPLLVVADQQTAGRGRGTNRWWTGRGSLAMSLLFGPDQLAIQQRSRSPLVALAAAVAVVQTVAPLVPQQTVGIGWPNDVLVAGGKLAGILVEVLSDGRPVVGIGVNTNNSLAEAPLGLKNTGLKNTATTLWELTGRQHDQTALLVRLLNHLENAFGQLASEPDRIAARADELCVQHGKTLRLQLGEKSICGRCAGIAPDGALLLETSEGRQAYYSGILQS